MPTGEYLLVMVDYFSRWVEVDVIRSNTTGAMIKCFERQLSRYGAACILRTDNGTNPNQVSSEIEEYLSENGH